MDWPHHSSLLAPSLSLHSRVTDKTNQATSQLLLEDYYLKSSLLPLATWSQMTSAESLFILTIQASC